MDNLPAALISARVAEALITCEAYKAANEERREQGHALAYDEAAFLKIIEKCGIHHNAVYGIIQDYRNG